jgi:pentatricopeptide repeat protein
LSALARGGRWEQAEKLFAEMETLDCRPDELSYSSLLHAYANAKKLDKLKALSEDIYAEKVESHHGLVKTLVLVNSKVNNLPDTEKAFLELRRRRGSLDINVLNAMVSVYGKNRMVKKVEEILSLMKGSSINLSTATYNSLMHMYSRLGDCEKCENILTEIKSSGARPDRYSYNTMIYAYGIKGQMKEASRLFSEMKSSGLVPDIVTYNIFVKSYVANSMFEEAIDLVRYMVTHGCKPNERTYNSILQVYCSL